METFLRAIPQRLPQIPKAIIVVSAHWETQGFCFTGSNAPPLIFDYYGFPKHTYALQYNVPGAPAIAEKAAMLLRESGLAARTDNDRGIDHGVFVPLMVAFPDAVIPVIEMSLDNGLDPALHIKAGRALATLRDEGVLIIGSGMSFHNTRAFDDSLATARSEAFDNWLNQAVELPFDARGAALQTWSDAPGGRFSHPTEEHLIPLMVAAGASEDAGQQIYADTVLSVAISGFQFN